MKIFSLAISFFILCGFYQLQAEEVLISPATGESFILDVDPSEPFFNVIDHIHEHLIGSVEEETEEKLQFSYSLDFPRVAAKKVKQKTARYYSLPVTAKEKENIRYIIRSLAKYQWDDLAKEKSTLEKVGDSINHIHPLRFLQCVFTDEELKTGLFVIRHKSIVWGKYYDGLKKSLNEESQSNILQFVDDFAHHVGVSPHAILPYIQARQWSGLIDYLLNSIPRQGDTARYGL